MCVLFFVRRKHLLKWSGNWIVVFVLTAEPRLWERLDTTIDSIRFFLWESIWRSDLWMACRLFWKNTNSCDSQYHCWKLRDLVFSRWRIYLILYSAVLYRIHYRQQLSSNFHIRLVFKKKRLQFPMIFLVVELFSQTLFPYKEAMKCKNKYKIKSPDDRK